jgi:hypothetical protein
MKKLTVALAVFITSAVALCQGPTSAAIFNPMGVGTVPQLQRYSGGLPVFGPVALPSLTVPTALITDAPYNAKCDGHTDDHIAIQSAINAVLTAGNGVGVVEWPPSTSVTTVQQCNVGTAGLTVPANSNLTINFNNSFIAYTGSGHMIEAICTGCYSPIGTYLTLQNMEADLTGGTSAATAVYVDGTNLTMTYWSTGGQAGYYAVKAVDQAQYTGYYGGTDGRFLLQNTVGIYSQSEYYAASTHGAVPTNISAVEIDSPATASTYVNLTCLYDASDGAGSGDVCFEFADSLGTNGAQSVDLINATLHSSLSPLQHNFKWDASGDEAVHGTMTSWDGDYSTIWTGAFLGDLLVGINPQVRIVNGIFTSGVTYPISPGTPVALPTCVSAIAAKSATAGVSDATAPAFMVAYTGGSNVQARILCRGINGAAYAWVTY